MTEIKPQFLDTLPYAAKFLRQFPRDILTEGIVATNDLIVTQLDTPGMGVKVASGVGYVQGDQATTQGHYRIYNDASKNLTIAAADVTHPRKDRIIAQIYDSVDISGAEDKWALEVLTGDPAASPVVPSLPDNALDLAIVDVAANEDTILNAHITDQRSQIALQNIDLEYTIENLINNTKARAYLSAHQENLVSGAITKVLLNAEDYDIGSDFDIVNNKFVAPINGFYQICAVINWRDQDMVANKRYMGFVYKNGAILLKNSTHLSETNKSLSNCFSDMVYLLANDYIELYAHHETGANTADVEGVITGTSLTVYLTSV